MQNNNTGAMASNWIIKDTLFPEAQAHALRALAEGKSDKEIARERGISPDGAYNIFRRLRTKWGTKKRSALVAEAIARGIISPLMVLICIASVLSGMANPDIEMRHNSNRRTPTRLTVRRVASLMVRGKRGSDALDVDFEFSGRLKPWHSQYEVMAKAA